MGIQNASTSGILSHTNTNMISIVANTAYGDRMSTWSIDATHRHQIDLSGNTDSESQNHTHSVTASGTISVTTNPTFTGSTGTTSSNDTDAIENRPTNYTIRIWKRTA